MNALFNLLLDILYPRCCLICRKAGIYPLCGECIRNFDYLPSACCEKCGLPLPGGLEECTACDAGHHYDRLWSCCFYRGSMKRAIALFKYQGKKVLAPHLAMLLADVFNKEKLGRYVDLIMPVPLHQERLKERGFNQALLLSEALARHTGISHQPEVIIRVRKTASLVRMGRYERRSELNHAFELRCPEKVKDALVLVVDDVITTCSTMNEIAGVLKAGGAKAVLGLSLARTPQSENPEGNK